MNSFIWNLVLAICWMAISDDFSTFSLLVGMVVGLLVLYPLRLRFSIARYFRKIIKIISFVIFYSFEIIKANLRVAYDVLTPRFRMRPGVVAISLDAKTNLEIVLLSNLLSLTPGTLSLDVSADKTKIYIHSMFIDETDLSVYVWKIKMKIEKRVLELLR